MVSVIISCYNYAKYLPFCLESVLCQTYGDFEIIIVNDGSTDNTAEVVEEYLPNPLIRYIRQENAGQAHAKNTGIRAATGEFIAFLDSDDFWETDKLKKQMPLFSDPRVGVVYSRARFIDENGRSLNLSVGGEYQRPRTGRITEHLFFDNFIPFSSSIVRRECLGKAGIFDESIKMGIDWDLWLRISVHFGFAYVDEPLLIYRIGHSGQMSRNFEERQRCSDRIIQKFLCANPGLLPKSTIRNALTYTYLSRGYFYERINFKKSAMYHMMAFKINALSPSVYRGIVRLIVRQFI